MLAWTIGRFEAAKTIDQIVVVVAEENLLYASEHIVDRYGFDKIIKLVIGGDSRFESVYRGIKSLPLSTQFVAIHDGARPLVTPDDIDRVVSTAQEERAAILAAPISDTVKRAQDGFILATLDRTLLYGAQTPQVFQYDLIKAAYERGSAENNSDRYTDDAALIEAAGFKVKVVEPTGPNLKVTTQTDFDIVRSLLMRETDGGD